MVEDNIDITLPYIVAGSCMGYELVSSIVIEVLEKRY